MTAGQHGMLWLLWFGFQAFFEHRQADFLGNETADCVIFATAFENRARSVNPVDFKELLWQLAGRIE